MLLNLSKKEKLYLKKDLEIPVRDKIENVRILDDRKLRVETDAAIEVFICNKNFIKTHKNKQNGKILQKLERDKKS